MTRKLYIAGGPNVFAFDAVKSIFERAGYQLTMKMKEADLVCFNGGADINPGLYGETKHPLTSFQSGRDAVEIACYNFAVANRIPMVGICRGAQLLNVMCGGTLWQHVDGHAGNPHEVVDIITKKRFITSSLHHQMMRPGKDATIIGVSFEATKKERMGRNNTLKLIVVNGKKGIENSDPEVVYYDKQRCLCFQGHPEFTGTPGLTEQFMEYVETYLMNKSADCELEAESCGC
jgi:hypothetical protein